MGTSYYRRSLGRNHVADGDSFDASHPNDSHWIGRLSLHRNNSLSPAADLVRAHLQVLAKTHRVILWKTKETRDYRGPIPFSESSVASICNGIIKSPTLLVVSVIRPIRSDEKTIDSYIRQAIGDHSAALFLFGTHTSVAGFHQVCEYLLQTQKVKDFEMLIQGSPNELPIVGLVVHKINPWVTFLTNDVPAKFWPKILAQALAWHRPDQEHARGGRFVSHTCYDALYFLIREKHDVLIPKYQS